MKTKQSKTKKRTTAGRTASLRCDAIVSHEARCTLQPGTIITLAHGLPFKLETAATVSGHPNNFYAAGLLSEPTAVSG